MSLVLSLMSINKLFLHSGKNKNAAVVSELIKMVTEKGGLDYAEQKMNEFKEKAINGLMEFDNCEARTSLIELMEYITTRKN